MTVLLPIEFVKVDSSMPIADFNAVGVDLAALIVDSNLATTKTEARRHIRSGAIKLNDQVVNDPFARLALRENQVIVIEHEIPSEFIR